MTEGWFIILSFDDGDNESSYKSLRLYDYLFISLGGLWFDFTTFCEQIEWLQIVSGLSLSKAWKVYNNETEYFREKGQPYLDSWCIGYVLPITSSIIE